MPFPFVPLALAGGAALAGGLSGLTAKRGRYKQINRFSPEQQQALNNQLQQGLQNFNPQGQEDLARKNFQTQTIPSIAERFASMGENRGSSGLFGQLGAAGANLESQLAALRGQYGLQQLRMGLTPQNENEYVPGGPTCLSGSLGGLSGGLGNAAGLGFGQYFGAFGNSTSPTNEPSNAPSGGGGSSQDTYYQDLNRQYTPPSYAGIGGPTTQPSLAGFNPSMAGIQGQQTAMNPEQSYANILNRLNPLANFNPLQPQYGRF